MRMIDKDVKKMDLISLRALAAAFARPFFIQSSAMTWLLLRSKMMTTY